MFYLCTFEKEAFLHEMTRLILKHLDIKKTWDCIFKSFSDVHYLIGCAVEQDENVVVGVSLELVRPLAAVEGVHQTDVFGSDFVAQYLRMFKLF